MAEALGGAQNIFLQQPSSMTYVPFLIGFFVLLERAALDAVGGVDATLPGGDDLDLSIRLRQAGATPGSPATGNRTATAFNTSPAPGCAIPTVTGSTAAAGSA